jgi:D-arabinose 1-dehydrogenase-like Zn-dependent alcohol dehydrogenase
MMRAVQVRELHRPFQLSEIPVPEPGAGEVRVCVHACGVCAGDALVREGIVTDPSFPRVPGHEVAGTIDKLGSNVPG